ASRYDEVRSRLIEATEACPTGNPRDEKTICGPMMTLPAAETLLAWGEEARSGGARGLAGGSREDLPVRPILVEGRAPDVKVGCEEAFGPVVGLSRFETMEEAIGAVNASQYGIQCGVFTRDAAVADRFYRELEVGGVIVDDYPTLRFDNMPYGGEKRS